MKKFKVCPQGPAESLPAGSCGKFEVDGTLRKMALLTAAVVLCSICGHAQDSTAVKGNGNYTIQQDEQITKLVEQYKEYNRKKEFTDGYRIQVSYTDIRDEVYRNKAALYKQFPELTSYVEYEQPNFKLRLGDFKTRLEATYYLQQVVPLYTGAFIVKDKIKMK